SGPEFPGLRRPAVGADLGQHAAGGPGPDDDGAVDRGLSGVDDLPDRDRHQLYWGRAAGRARSPALPVAAADSRDLHHPFTSFSTERPIVRLSKRGEGGATMRRWRRWRVHPVALAGALVVGRRP